MRKPLNTKDEGVSPGCTRLLRKNTCKHTMAEGQHQCLDFIERFYVSVVNRAIIGVKFPKKILILCFCVNGCYPFAREAVCSWGVGVRKQLRQTWFPLLLHPAAVGHSEQVHPVAI